MGADAADARRAGDLTVPGLVLGVGLGGFLDGIVLHQILQWHHMLTGGRGGEPATTVPGLEANTLADGLFHAATFTVTVAGIALLWRAVERGGARPSGVHLLGLVLAGWGAFNLVEGIVDHHLLDLHHVRDDSGAPLSWDLGFLASGVLLGAVGWMLARRPTRP
jgi:uncharacterized membrane protein